MSSLESYHRKKNSVNNNAPQFCEISHTYIYICKNWILTAHANVTVISNSDQPNIKQHYKTHLARQRWIEAIMVKIITTRVDRSNNGKNNNHKNIRINEPTFDHL